MRIFLRLDEATDRILLHARGLEVRAAHVEHARRKHQAAPHVEADREALTLVLSGRVGPGDAVAEIDYEGRVGRAMQGLYLSADGAERCLATQCEPTDARAILPCFDEPSFKAPFALRVVAPAGATVLANGASEGRSAGPEPGTEEWRFAATPPMSSYLLALAVGPFAATPAATARAVPFRVWALGGKERLGGHARDLAARLLPWFEDYFGAPYAFGKYDQVAVPSFSFGAMENPGLVVFRASLLLLDPATTAWRDRKAVDLVVAHEFAHMWFGDLVTMRWWDDLWLNEAFAEWIAHRAVHALEPDLEVWHEFQSRTVGALATDALASTHAIYHPVATPEEAAELFDAITYGKGSAVLRMLETFLGEEDFRAGLRTYMKAFGFGNAAGADLWQRLGQASDRPVEEIMRSWITQPGHPVVRLEAEERGRVLRLNLRQERARSSPLVPRSPQTWRVPLVVRFDDGTGPREVRHLLAAASGSLEVPLSGALRFVVPNAGEIGFYRSDPDDALLARLVASWKDLAPSERRGLLRDQAELVKSGDRPMTRYLELLQGVLSGDDHYAVVGEEVAALREIERILEGDGDAEALAGLRRWTVARLGPPLEHLGLAPRSGEDDPTRQRRATLLRAVAGIGRDGATTTAARDLAARERQAPASVEANLASTAVAIAAQLGDAAHFDLHVRTLVGRREAHAAPLEVDRYLYTLASFREPALVDLALALFADGTVAKQSVGPLLRIMLAEPHSQRAAWEHVKARWDFVKKELGDPWVQNIVEASGHLPPALAEEVVGFYEAHLGAVARQALGRTKERLAERRELLARVLPDLRAWARGLEG